MDTTSMLLPKISRKNLSFKVFIFETVLVILKIHFIHYKCFWLFFRIPCILIAIRTFWRILREKGRILYSCSSNIYSMININTINNIRKIFNSEWKKTLLLMLLEILSSTKIGHILRVNGSTTRTPFFH